VVTDDDEMIEQLFIRLNSGEPVTGAERRNAMPGPVPAMIRELTMHPFFQSRIRFGTKRMQEFNLAAKLLLIEFKNVFVDTKARNLDNFVQDAVKVTQVQLPPYRKAVERVQKNLETLTLVFKPRDKLLTAQGHIPVYYWLARNMPRYRDDLRPFLEEFIKKIRANLAISRTDPKKADPEIMNYYTRGRTTNDQGSLEDRYKILSRRLKEYVK
jgi:hypothetical protein